jgi:hypothetical protein
MPARFILRSALMRLAITVRQCHQTRGLALSGGFRKPSIGSAVFCAAGKPASDNHSRADNASRIATSVLERSSSCLRRLEVGNAAT